MSLEHVRGFSPGQVYCFWSKTWLVIGHMLFQNIMLSALHRFVRQIVRNVSKSILISNNKDARMREYS